MVTMTLPFIATHYLDNTNQWEYVGMDRRKVAINHIKTGQDATDIQNLNQTEKAL